VRNSRALGPLPADLIRRHLELGGALQNGKRNSRSSVPDALPGRLRRLAASTVRLWRGVSYDEAIAVANAARRQLGLDRPQERRRVVARLTRPELDQLLAHAYGVRPRDGLLVKTLLLTGCRVSEFVALDVDDFSYATQDITVRLGKGKKDRVVPILPALADELATHKRPAQQRAPLPGPLVAGVLSQRRVQQIVKELAAGAGITKAGLSPPHAAHRRAAAARRGDVARAGAAVPGARLHHHHADLRREFYGR
jgi:integrase